MKKSVLLLVTTVFISLLYAGGSDSDDSCVVVSAHSSASSSPRDTVSLGSAMQRLHALEALVRATNEKAERLLAIDAFSRDEASTLHAAMVQCFSMWQQEKAAFVRSVQQFMQGQQGAPLSSATSLRR